MNKQKLWVLGTVITIVVVIGGGWLFGVQPQMSAIAAANQMRDSVHSQNNLNEILLAKLKRDYQSIGQLRLQLTTLQAAVPGSPEIPAFVTELNTLAKNNGITVKSFVEADAKPYSPSTGAAGTPTTTNSKITPANFDLIPIQLGVSGSYSKVLEFVHQLQIGLRLFFVSTLTSSGSTDVNGVAKSKKSVVGSSEQVDASVGGFIYVLRANG